MLAFKDSTLPDTQFPLATYRRFLSLRLRNDIPKSNESFDIDQLTMKTKQYYVYIMNSPTGTLYVGVTSNLERRVYEHKQKIHDGFTKKYNVTRLAYYEETPDIHVALAREKQIKKWRRSKKIALIETTNPNWQDLSEAWNDD